MYFLSIIRLLLCNTYSYCWNFTWLQLRVVVSNLERPQVATMKYCNLPPCTVIVLRRIKRTEFYDLIMSVLSVLLLSHKRLSQKHTSQKLTLKNILFKLLKVYCTKIRNYFTLKEVIPPYCLMSKRHFIKWTVLFFRGIVFLK